MARGVNKVIILGLLGADPEVRYTNSGTAIANLRLATNEQWTDKQSGERQQRTEWHRVKLFGKLAEIAGEYLKKGRQLYVEGSLRTEKYMDKEGIERYSTEIIGTELQMLGGSGEQDSRANSTQGTQRSQSNGHQRGGASQHRSQGDGNRNSRNDYAPVPGDHFPNDDLIPF